jgi:Rieske Fe-S protein
MTEPRTTDPEPREPIDARVDSAGREGLTGTAPATLYRSIDEAEQITKAPDGRPMADQPPWRTDFPIDWPQDTYVERRDFMKFMVLTSLALTVGQFWIAVRNSWRRLRGGPPIARIASLGDVRAAGVMTFTYPGPQDDCVLIRTADNGLVAYSQKCTHLSCAVRPVMSERTLQCPCHDGLFDLPSGRPIAGPPRRPLDRVHLEVRGTEIYATGVEQRTT